jgi:hypothetical protein
MNTRTWIAAICLLAVTIPTLGQARLSSPYTAMATADRVAVRTRPDLRAPVSTRLDKGQLVEVTRNVNDEWAQVEPVEGCFAVIAKQFVTPSADGKTGTVKSDTVRVRAGGELMQGNFNDVKDFLNTGDKVRILGQTGAYYKIQPGDGIYWFVSRQFLRKLTPAQAVAARQARARAEAGTQRAPVRLAQPDAPEDGDEPGDGEQTASAEPEPKPDPVRQKFQALEKELEAELKKPYEQRDYAELLGRYQNLEIPDGHIFQYGVQNRVEFLKDALQQREELEALNERLKKSAAAQQELKEKRTRLEMQADEVAIAPAAYAAQGVLKPSALYTGKAGTPRRFLLHNAGTGRVEAFVQASSGAVDLAKHAGQHVGIFGARTFNAELSAVLVEAQQVRVINANPDLPDTERARPVIPKPLPKETPQPAKPETPAGGTEAPDEQPEQMPIPDFGENGDAPDQAKSDAETEDDAKADSDKTSNAEADKTETTEDPALNTVDEKEYR